MASSIFVNGPAHLYLAPAPASVGGTPTYAYLGQTEGDLMKSDSMMESDIHVDQHGPALPDDVAYLGEETFLQGTLIKYVESVWQSFQARVAGGTMGTIAAADIGTLLHAERKFFLLAVTSGYQSKTPFAAQPPGYTFPFIYLSRNADTSLSVQKKRNRFSIRALPDWLPDGSGVLYYPYLPGSNGLLGTLPAVS